MFDCKNCVFFVLGHAPNAYLFPEIVISTFSMFEILSQTFDIIVLHFSTCIIFIRRPFCTFLFYGIFVSAFSISTFLFFKIIVLDNFVFRCISSAIFSVYDIFVKRFCFPILLPRHHSQDILTYDQFIKFICLKCL